MAKPFIRQEDCHQKLHNTFCTYEGLPVWVEVSMDFPCNQIHITNPQDVSKPSRYKKFTRLIDVGDPKFVITPPELGYVQNTDDACVYLKRTPIRRSRQGLSDESMLGQRADVLFLKAAECLWTNVYPLYKDVFTQMSKDPGRISMCFDKHACLFRAIDGSLNLMYQDQVIGKYSKDSFKLNDTLDCKDILITILEDLGVPCV